jgi:WD40 repeat protein
MESRRTLACFLQSRSPHFSLGCSDQASQPSFIYTEHAWSLSLPSHEYMVTRVKHAEISSLRQVSGVLEGHCTPSGALSWGKAHTLAAAAADGSVRLWDASAAPPAATDSSGGGDGGGGAPLLATLRGHGTQPVTAVAFSPDGRRLATAAIDGRVRLWDAATEAVEATFGPATPARPESTSANVAAAATRLQVAPPVMGTAPAAARLVSPPPAAAAICSDAGAFPTHPPPPPPTPPAAMAAAVVGAAWSPDGGTLATLCAEGTLRLYNSDTHRLLAVLPPPQDSDPGPAGGPAGGPSGGLTRGWGPAPVPAPAELAFSPDGALLAAPCGERVRLVDVAARAVEAPAPPPAAALLAGHGGTVAAAAFSPDGARLATVATDGTARVWALPSAAPGPAGWTRPGSMPGLAQSGPVPTLGRMPVDGQVTGVC